MLQKRRRPCSAEVPAGFFPWIRSKLPRPRLHVEQPKNLLFRQAQRGRLAILLDHVVEKLPLQRLGNAKAYNTLKALAQGAAEAWLTREARALLQRMEKRAGTQEE